MILCIFYMLNTYEYNCGFTYFNKKFVTYMSMSSNSYGSHIGVLIKQRKSFVIHIFKYLILFVCFFLREKW